MCTQRAQQGDKQGGERRDDRGHGPRESERRTVDPRFRGREIMFYENHIEIVECRVGDHGDEDRQGEAAHGPTIQRLTFVTAPHGSKLADG